MKIIATNKLSGKLKAMYVSMPKAENLMKDDFIKNKVLINGKKC